MCVCIYVYICVVVCMVYICKCVFCVDVCLSVFECVHVKHMISAEQSAAILIGPY